jgi:hypothetical protein
MQILVSIDDTDNLESRGTGEIASLLAKLLEERGWGKARVITRHQLLVHPDIPYTSHNSAMCFAAEIEEQYFVEYLQMARQFLANESAPGSDPGLCVVALEHLKNKVELKEFAFKAKKIVLNKEEAYEVAAKTGAYLSEHGGEGIGVIGALAGAGLRLSGMDGRLRGKLKVNAPTGFITAGEIKQQSGVEVVQSTEGQLIADHETICLGETVKAIMLNGRTTLLVFPNKAEDAMWQTCTKNYLKRF